MADPKEPNPDKPPQFDLSELPDIDSIETSSLRESDPPPPQVDAQDRPAVPETGGGFDASEEILTSLQNINTQLTQIAQMLQSILTA